MGHVASRSRSKVEYFSGGEGVNRRGAERRGAGDCEGEKNDAGIGEETRRDGILWKRERETMTERRVCHMEET